MYIVLYDYNCNGKNFIAGNIINPNICSTETLNYLLSIGAIKPYNKPNDTELSTEKEKKETVVEVKEIKKTKTKNKKVK